MRSPHMAVQTATLATVRSSLLRLLAVASVALLAATVAWPAGAAHADRGLTSGVVAEDDDVSCGPHDYDCWNDYIKSLIPDDDDDTDGGSDDGASAPRKEPRDLSLCVEGIDYAGTGCVEDHTGGTKSTEPAPRTSPTRTLATR